MERLGKMEELPQIIPQVLVLGLNSKSRLFLKWKGLLKEITRFKGFITL